MWCWWCCHPFENKALELPYRYDEKRNKFTVCGKFCSWNCMKAFALSRYGDVRGGIICGNITMMRRKMYGIFSGLRAAPDRYRLNVFGGDMTIEEFRSGHDVDVGEPKPIETQPAPKLMPSVPIVSSTKKMEDIKGATSKNDALKLKRNKPLVRSHNNLEAALGLIVKNK
jgi:hypothetical protein